jgi:hypothetical protein
MYVLFYERPQKAFFAYSKFDALTGALLMAWEEIPFTQKEAWRAL